VEYSDEIDEAVEGLRRRGIAEGTFRLIIPDRGVGGVTSIAGCILSRCEEEAAGRGSS
jgi:hypothetical protein